MAKKLMRMNKKKIRRSYRRKYKANPRRAILEGFPMSKLVKLRYIETIALNPGAGAISQAIYRANGAYDPNQPGYGHSPMGYDQWAQIYSNYCVVGAQITMRYVPTTASATIPGYFGILLDTTTTGTTRYTNTNYLLESKLTGKNAKIAGIPQNGDSRARFASVVKNFSAKKFFGVKNIQDGKEYSSAIDNTPQNQAYFCCWFGALNSIQDPAETNFEILIDYIVLFKDPKPLTESGDIGGSVAWAGTQPGPTGAGQGGTPD